MEKGGQAINGRDSVEAVEMGEMAKAGEAVDSACSLSPYPITRAFPPCLARRRSAAPRPCRFLSRRAIQTVSGDYSGGPERSDWRSGHLHARESDPEFIKL